MVAQTGLCLWKNFAGVETKGGDWELIQLHLILSWYTELNTEQKLLVKQLKLDLPSQPPPRITAPAGKPSRATIQQL